MTLQQKTQQKTRLMGIVNVTPDSFSDGGQFFSAEAAISRALTLQQEGADYVDIGAESTRPSHVPISDIEEMTRLKPVLSGLRGKLTIPLSVDTTKADVADMAVSLGANIINDVWGLQKDPQMAKVVAQHRVKIIIMHNATSVDENRDIVLHVKDFFQRSLEIAQQAGIERDNIILDPGVGFGKSFEQNLVVLHHLQEFSCFNLPILVGASRKSFIGKITGHAVDERLFGTLAAHLFSLNRGAAILRVHDVRAHVDACAIWQALAFPSHKMVSVKESQ